MEEIELIKDVQTRLNDTMKHLGCYMVESSIATSDASLVDPEGAGVDSIDNEDNKDIKEKIENGESVFVIQGMFAVGDVAFSDRVLYPEKDELNTKVKTIQPTVTESHVAKIQEALAAGKSIEEAFGYDSLDDDEEEE